MLLVLACLALAPGCTWGKAKPAANDPAAPYASDTPNRKLDASPRQMRILSLQVFALELPRGTVSANKELWRRIDEQAVAPGTYDVLWANGVRVGGAPLAELEHVQRSLGIESAERIDILGRGTGRQVKEFEIESNISEKTLFWFDADKRHHGRTFTRCTTLMSIAFEPTPGREQSVRISMTPVVRGNTPRTIVTPAGDDYEVNEVRETNLLDLSLAAEVPIGRFLIVAPSDEAAWETNLGRQFFCRERDGERFERMYILIPHVVAFRTAEQH